MRLGDVYCRKCGEPRDFYYGTERSDFVRGVCCSHCRERGAPEEPDKERALASIIESLNEIEGLVTHLSRTLIDPAPSIVTSEEADTITGRFFFSCQVAEERIKTVRKKSTSQMSR